MLRNDTDHVYICFIVRQAMLSSGIYKNSVHWYVIPNGFSRSRGPVCDTHQSPMWFTWIIRRFIFQGTHIHMATRPEHKSCLKGSYCVKQFYHICMQTHLHQPYLATHVNFIISGSLSEVERESGHINNELDIVDQWSNRILRPVGGGSSGQWVGCNWTSFKITSILTKIQVMFH